MQRAPYVPASLNCREQSGLQSVSGSQPTGHIAPVAENRATMLHRRIHQATQLHKCRLVRLRAAARSQRVLPHAPAAAYDTIPLKRVAPFVPYPCTQPPGSPSHDTTPSQASPILDQPNFQSRLAVPALLLGTPEDTLVLRACIRPLPVLISIRQLLPTASQ